MAFVFDWLTRPFVLLSIGLLSISGGVGILVFQPSSPDNSQESVNDDTYVDPIEAMNNSDHDHANLTQHYLNTPNIKLIDYHNMNPDAKNQPPSPGKMTEIEFRGDYAYVAAYNDLYIVDVKDPYDIQVVGHYHDRNGRIIDVKVSDDGNWAIVNNELTNVDNLDPVPAGINEGFNSIDLIDVSDKTNPVIKDTWINPPAGYHNQHIHTINGEQFLFLCDGYGDLYTGRTRPGTQIAKIVIPPVGGNATPKIVPWGEFRIDPADTNGGRLYNHDNVAQKHPITGQDLLYIAYWDAGLRVVDISNPPAIGGNWRPPQIGKWDDFDPQEEGNIHHAVPYPGLIDGRHFTVIAPEFGGFHPNTGIIRIIDTTDPTNPTLVGTWTIPGNHTMPAGSGLSFSPHNLDLGNGHIYLAHYHAGIWVIDISTLEKARNPSTLGYYLPHGDPELNGSLDSSYNNFWSGLSLQVPFNWGVQYYRGYIYASDLATGMYVLQYDGDISDVG